MAEAVKVCPACGEQALLFEDTCGCGADLSSVPPTLPGAVSADDARSVPSPTGTPIEQPAAVDEHGQSAESGAGVLQSAAEQAPVSLSGVPDGRASAAPAGETIVLELVADARQRFTMRSGQTVGRGRDADVCLAGFAVPDDISRVHAVLEHRPTGWYVRHVGRANFIVVDGQRYRDRDTQVPLVDGTVLALTSTAFVVRQS